MTHRGAIRPENQDALSVAGGVRTGDMTSPEMLESGGYPLLLAVIDGMGGYEGGAAAARILAETLSEAAIGRKFSDSEFDFESDEKVLRELLSTAARLMGDAAAADPRLARMGAAVGGVLLRSRSALVFNCGDCRVYRVSGKEIERLSRDHSIVQILFERGEIDEDGMRTHPEKNIVTSAVSSDMDKDFELFVRGASRCDGDSFFLCSDGVWEALDSKKLSEWMSRPLGASGGLFEALLSSGCRDNVSFIWQAG
jgi:protein phosphatase